MKLRICKSLLWCLVGLSLPVFLMRLVHGPGSVTALTDIVPWGLWKGGGVVALVAIGGAGFTLAMLTYIFRMDHFKPVVRGAVLMGLLCYSSVGFALTVDIGIWWRIVYPVVHWQYHSVLFEVAWCIMLYLGVLWVEFSHTLLESFGWKRLLHIVEKVSLLFVIAGISLSTLHQSSLGTLFLATPFRLHDLWYTDLLPLHFFITAIGLGCLTISVVTLFVFWLHDRKPPMGALSRLGKVSAWMLTIYAVLRFGGILVTGKGGFLFEASVDTVNFWIEIVLSTILPAALLFRSKFRESARALFIIGLCATVGFCLNRVNVSGLAALTLTDTLYFPSWTEWAMTLGILAGAALIFLTAIERLRLYDGLGREDERGPAYAPGTLDHTDWGALYFGGQRLGEVKTFSLVFILAAALSFGAMSDDAVFGTAPVETPAKAARVVEGLKAPGPEGEGGFLALASDTAAFGEKMSPTALLLIDGNRDGRDVLFDHEGHIGRLGGRDDVSACARCHHMNNPMERATQCAACHRDMYLARSIFDHDVHAERAGGNAGCAECHTDRSLPPVRPHVKDCAACHEGMIRRVLGDGDGKGLFPDLAPGYREAMHGMCIACHEEMDPEAGKPESFGKGLAGCVRCHGGPTEKQGR